MEKTFYTAGELAKLTGVSYKTIRHYHKIGLLNPVEFTEAGYKLYSKASVEILQRILMLKYLNFSLEEIKEILEKEDTKEPFSKQEKLLQAQIQHLEQVLLAVEKMKKVSGEERWEQMLQIIQMTQQKEEIIRQYVACDNLQKRIHIHAYSTSKVDWFQWVFERLKLEAGMQILEIGCGNGKLWTSIAEQLPCNLQIVLTDHSEDMLRVAKTELEKSAKYFKDKNIQFTFSKKNAENFVMESGSFHRVIANHMLYHVSDENRPHLLETCAGLLNDDGMFFASTVGNTHMAELFTLIKKFDDKIETPDWISAGFELENGKEQLEKVFSTVHMQEMENDLLVPDPVVIMDYIESLPGNIKEILKDKRASCMEYLRGIVSEETPFFIHKSTGAFWAYKR